MAGAVHNPNGIQLCSQRPHWDGEHCLGLFFWFYLYLVDCIWVVKSSQLPAKIAAYLVSISQLLCLVIFFTDGVVEMKFLWTGRLL